MNQIGTFGSTDAKERYDSLVTLVEAPADEETFDVLDGTVIVGYNMREMYGILLSRALAVMRERWQEWPLTSKAKWDYRFSQYAEERTHYKSSTIDNLVRAGTAWLYGSPDGLPDEVELYDREGHPTGEVITPNPFSLSVSKLVFSTAALNDGRLTNNPVAMGQLFNPDVGAHIVNDTLQGRPAVENPGDAVAVLDASLKLYVEGSFLWVKKGRDKNWVAELNVEGFNQDPLVKEALRYVIAACQVKGWE